MDRVKSDFWTPLQLLSQERIRRLSSSIEANPRVVSQGRIVDVFFEKREDFDEVRDAVVSFARAMVSGPSSLMPELVNYLQSSGLHVDDTLVSISGDITTVNRKTLRLSERSKLPWPFLVEELSPEAPEEDVEAIQALQLQLHVTPLTRDGMVGARGHTTVLRLADGRIVGVSSLLDISGKDGRRAGWVNVLGTCVDAIYRKGGVSSYLLAKSIQLYMRQRGAARFLACTLQHNAPALALGKICGMSIDPTYRFIHSSVPMSTPE